MPLRPWPRDRDGVLPPVLADGVGSDHPVRCVAACVEALTPADWAGGGIVAGGHPGGAPASDPAVRLAARLDGFRRGVRSCRKPAPACAEPVPFLWLTGGRRPDPTTLWRFSQRHRAGRHVRFERTVATAAASGVVVGAIPAVDGTKSGGNAAKDRTLDAAARGKLLARVAAAIADLAAQHRPAGPTRVNRTDPAAGLVQARQGVIAGSNAQAAVARVVLASPRHPRARPARLITATAGVAAAADHGQLVPMLARVEATTARGIAPVLTDGGDHDGSPVAAGAARGQRVAMPEAQAKALAAPDHKDRFAADPAADTDPSPAGQTRGDRGTKARTERPVARGDRGGVAICRVCPACGVCTTDQRRGRALAIGPHEAAGRAHRVWMATEEARTLYRQRKDLSEPVFGVLKEEWGGRRFRRRGLANVRAEWARLATAFTLRTCVRRWQRERAAA